MKYIKTYEFNFRDLFRKYKASKNKEEYLILKYHFSLEIVKVISKITNDKGEDTFFIFNRLYKYENKNLIKLSGDDTGYFSKSGLYLIQYKSNDLEECKKIIKTLTTIEEDELLKKDTDKYNL